MANSQIKITAESINDIVTLADVRISPDGKQAVFVRVSVSKDENKYHRNLWLKDLRSDAPARQITFSNKDTSPRWSEDGAYLAFLSGRDDKAQVFILSVNGIGEARKVTQHKNGVQSFELSPDGKQVAYVAAVRADERANEDNPPTDDAKAKPAETPDPRVVNKMPYRTGTTYIEDRYKHIYVSAIQQGDEIAKAQRITDGDVNYAQPTWSRDGKYLYSNALRDPESGELFLFSDVVQIDVSKPREYTRHQFAGFTSSEATSSPDGKWLAMQFSREDELAYRSPEIMLAALGRKGAIQKQPTDLTRKLDRSPGKFVWSRDSKYLYHAPLDHGRTNIHRIAIDTQRRQQLMTGEREIESFDVAADGRVVFVASEWDDPAALYVRERDGKIRALYQPNKKWVAEYAHTAVEEFTFESDEFEIQGWVIKPPNFDAKKKYPLAVQMHGGPHVMWSPWSPSTVGMWTEFQAMAAAGYVVFFCNPRGSDGYTEHFWHANRGDWGDGPMRDVIRGIEHVIARGYIDENRLCITGGSYAGYLTVWMIAHDARFAAAVSQRGVYNLISMRNVTDIPFFNDRENGSITPWDDAQLLWNRSPIAHINKINTPLLIEHSEQDFRVPISQAEELFQALKLQRKTVELVRWPREGHEVSRAGEPKHRIERIRRIIEWFDKYAPSKTKAH
jgi:dipeptidyl aminopeptidase/acylaminoacyl peptidase